MAFISLASKTWGSGPAITLKPSYEKKRDGANMKYRIKMSISPLTGESWFGYPIYMKTSLAGSLKDTKTLKSASPSQWSSAIEYTTGWFTISNKTSGTVSLSINIYSGSGNTRDNTYSYSLAVDPAASVLGTINNFTIGNAIDIPITKYSSGFTDTLVISLGTTTIKTISGITNGYDVTFTSSELNTIYNKLPSGPEGYFKFTLTTKSGSTTVGTSYVYATGTIPSSIKPSISSITATEAGSVPSSLGIFVKTKSKLKFVISGSAGTGASITSVKTTFCGVTYSGSSFTSNTINSSGDLVATVTITDSRSRSTSTTKTISVWNYSDPAITSARAYRCDANGNANESGTYFRVYLKAGGTSLGDRNTFSYKVEYKKTTDTSYTVRSFAFTSASIDTTSDPVSDIASTSSYNVRVVVSDRFKTITRELPIISSAFRTMNFKAGGRAVAIGKIAEIDNTFDVGLETRLSGGLGDTIRSYLAFNRGSWGKPTKGLITQVTDNTNAQHSVMVGLASDGATRLYGIDLLDSDTDPTMRIDAGGQYIVLGSRGLSLSKAFNGNFEASGLLKSTTSHGNTVTIGSQNASWCHIYNSANIPFYFNRDIYINGNKALTAPVGTVVITSTNTNPSGTYGGTWELIDKEFTPGYLSGNFTASSATGCTLQVTRGGHSLTGRLDFAPSVDLEDSNVNIGTINFAGIGITRLGCTLQILGYSDAGNCAFMGQVLYDSGIVRVVDILPDPYIASGKACNLTFTATLSHTYMLDSACNKFYWKRTA